MKHPLIEKVEEKVKRREENFRVGDEVKVYYKIQEGDKERIQVFQGIVIAKKGKGANRTFTVRRVSFDVGVERIFPLHSPFIDKIEVVRSFKVRRAKLYFLREKVGKGARLKEKRKKT